MKVLFVCLGNICRSPTAEGIFSQKINDAGLSQVLSCDSAGTSAYHEGEMADRRMREHALNRGYELTSLARQLTPDDFKNFDLILTMDESNYRNSLNICPDDKFHRKLKRMVSFCRVHNVDKVPDPYFGGGDGFELVIDILEDSCEELLNQIKQQVT